MNALKLVVLVIAVAYGASVPVEDVVQFGNACGSCGSSSDVLQVSTCSISPSQITFPGSLSIDLAANLGSDVAAPIKLDVVIQKKIGIWITIPCINETLGSCTFDDICTQPSIGSICPLTHGDIKQTLQIPLPSVTLPDEVYGDYKLKAVASQNGKELGCVFIDLSVGQSGQAMIH